MEYVELADEQCVTLRRERILALEVDHYRLKLLIQEAGYETANLVTQQTEIERRIRLHRDEIISQETETMNEAAERP